MPLMENRSYEKAIQLPHDAKILPLEKLLKKIEDNIDRDVEMCQIKKRKDEGMI